MTLIRSPFFPPLPLQSEESPRPKRQRLSSNYVLEQLTSSTLPPSTPSPPIRPWESSPPSRRQPPSLAHYDQERCQTPVRLRRRYGLFVFLPRGFLVSPAAAPLLPSCLCEPCALQEVELFHLNTLQHPCEAPAEPPLQTFPSPAPLPPRPSPPIATRTPRWKLPPQPQPLRTAGIPNTNAQCLQPAFYHWEWGVRLGRAPSFPSTHLVITNTPSCCTPSPPSPSATAPWSPAAARICGHGPARSGEGCTGNSTQLVMVDCTLTFFIL